MGDVTHMALLIMVLIVVLLLLVVDIELLATFDVV
jgi:hypothetical protein